MVVLVLLKMTTEDQTLYEVSRKNSSGVDQGIVVIGIHTILGELLLEKLEKNPSVTSYHAVDLHAPGRAYSKKFKKLHFIKLDLIDPGADARLAKKLEEIGASLVVHTALKNNPSLNWVQAHELEVIGTLNIVSACKAAQVKKLVFCSTTAVYGASPKNPNYIDETHPLAAHPEAHFIRDKVEAEKQIAQVRKEAPEISLSVLRFALILGPKSKNYFTELFRRPIVPTLLGYDPLMQFVHEKDAGNALETAVMKNHPGIFNITGHGVIPLSYALREAGKFSLPVASFLAYPLVQVLWNLQLVSVPGKLLDYFRYLWVTDGEKAKREMNFVPTYSSKEAFLDFAKSQRLQEFQ
ncbi:MAG: NAD-dependent epimerase/dehydratase family protein [Deltaproteobacteria bacterium]|nr:NAD-dependent epimerase/dehydratase family protein [Deltaproteobacteria bacterium]